MTESSTGTFTNIAEIGAASSEDRDSTSGNKVEGEDDYSKADVIISISTGAAVYITIAIILVIIGTLIVLNIKFNIFND